MANAPKFSMPTDGGKPAGAPGFPSMVIVRDDTIEQPLSGQQGQQSAQVQGNGNEEIPDDVIDAFLNGQTAEEEGAQPQGQKQTPEDQTSGQQQQSGGDIQRQIQEAVAQAVAPLAGYIQGLVQGQGQGQQGGQRQGQPATYFDLAREKVKSRNPDLSDASVEFLAAPMADMMEEMDKRISGHISALQSHVGQVQTTMGRADLERMMDTWLEERKVPPDDRQDIKDLVALRTLQTYGQNATARHLRAVFEDITGRRLKAGVARTEARRTTLQQRNEQPPAGGRGAAGDADVTRQILKSKKPEDDIGGSRWQRLVARYIQG